MATTGGNLVQSLSNSSSTGSVVLLPGASNSLHQDFTNVPFNGKTLSILFQHATNQTQFELNEASVYTHATRTLTRPPSGVSFGTAGIGANTNFSAGGLIVSIVQSWRDVVDIWADLARVGQRAIGLTSLDGHTLVADFAPPARLLPDVADANVISLRSAVDDLVLVPINATLGEITVSADGGVRFSTSASAAQLGVTGQDLLTNVVTGVVCWRKSAQTAQALGLLQKIDPTGGFGYILQLNSGSPDAITFSVYTAPSTLTSVGNAGPSTTGVNVAAFSYNRSTGQLRLLKNSGAPDNYIDVTGALAANWVGQTSLTLLAGNPASASSDWHWYGACEYSSTAIATRDQLEGLLTLAAQRYAPQAKINVNSLALDMQVLPFTVALTSGSLDLQLIHRTSYVFSTVALTGELALNLPNAAAHAGYNVHVARTGGGEFDLVLTGTNLKLRKGMSTLVVSDGTAWLVIDDRDDIPQVRETASDFTLIYDTHAGKMTVATSATNITCRVRDTSPTISTYRVMARAVSASRTITFSPAAGTDGDGVTIGNVLGGSLGPFTIPSNTSVEFRVYVDANLDGASAVYQITVPVTSGGGGGYVPLTFSLQTGTTDAPAGATWRRYSNAGAVAVTLNATMTDGNECVLEKGTGSGTITITPAGGFTLNGTSAGRVLSGRCTVKRIGVDFVVDGAIPDGKSEPAIVTYAQSPVVPDNSFALAKLATIGAQTFLGRLIGTGTGAVNALTPAQLIQNLQGEPTDLYGQLSLPQSATGSQTGAASGRTWNLTGNITNVPVTAGWHALYLNSSGSAKTITPVSGSCIATKTAALVSFVTVANNEAVTAFGNGTNLWIMGDAS